MFCYGYTCTAPIYTADTGVSPIYTADIAVEPIFAAIIIYYSLYFQSYRKEHFFETDLNLQID